MANEEGLVYNKNEFLVPICVGVVLLLLYLLSFTSLSVGGLPLLSESHRSLIYGIDRSGGPFAPAPLSFWQTIFAWVEPTALWGLHASDPYGEACGLLFALSFPTSLQSSGNLSSDPWHRPIFSMFIHRCEPDRLNEAGNRGLAKNSKPASLHSVTTNLLLYCRMLYDICVDELWLTQWVTSSRDQLASWILMVLNM